MLLHRYQDSGWESLNKSFDRLDEALMEAGTDAQDAIAVGMTAVYDTETKITVATFPAGVSYLTAQKVALEALQREDDRDAQRRKARLEANQAQQTSGPKIEATDEGEELAKMIREFAEKVGQRFKALESVSVTLSWQGGAGPLLGGWSAPDGSGLAQAGVYRLMNTIAQCAQQQGVYQKILSEELAYLSNLVKAPQNDQTTSGTGTTQTDYTGPGTAVGSGTQQSTGDGVYPRIYNPLPGVDVRDLPRYTGDPTDPHEPGQAPDNDPHWPNGYDGRNERIYYDNVRDMAAKNYNPWFGPNGPPRQR